MAADYPNKQLIDKGIQLLVQRQVRNGDWPQEAISGVFNFNCMITYTSYRNVFPIWALARYKRKYS
jgi:squalene cyclase